MSCLSFTLETCEQTRLRVDVTSFRVFNKSLSPHNTAICMEMSAGRLSLPGLIRSRNTLPPRFVANEGLRELRRLN